jgi:ribosome maturation factor RimP
MTEYRAPKELAEFVREQAAKEGYCIVHLTTKGGTSSHVEVILDKEGGISLNECGAFNRKIMEWLDGNNMFTRGYVVDVCSPGLDRELRSDTEFEWAVGRKVTVVMHTPEGGNKEIVGKLVRPGTPEDVVIEDENGNTVIVKRKNVIKARLCVVL